MGLGVHDASFSRDLFLAYASEVVGDENFTVSSFEETLQSASQKEQALSFYQNVTIAVVAGALGVLMLLRPIPVPVQVHIPTLLFTLGVLLTLWDEPVWNEALGKACPMLARLQWAWPIFGAGALSMNWWIAKDGSSLSAFVLAAVFILLMRGKAERKPLWVLVAVGGLLLLRRTESLAAALLILAPFLALVLTETIARTKGRLDSRRKVWVPFSILLLAFFQVVALTTASK